jgi:hypothetical protein
LRASSLTRDVDKVTTGTRITIRKPKVISKSASLADNARRFGRCDLRRARLTQVTFVLSGTVCKSTSAAACTFLLANTVCKLASVAFQTQRRAGVALPETKVALGAGRLTSDIDLLARWARLAARKTKIISKRAQSTLVAKGLGATTLKSAWLAAEAVLLSGDVGERACITVGTNRVAFKVGVLASNASIAQCGTRAALSVALDAQSARCLTSDVVLLACRTRGTRRHPKLFRKSTTDALFARGFGVGRLKQTWLASKAFGLSSGVGELTRVAVFTHTFTLATCELARSTLQAQRGARAALPEAKVALGAGSLTGDIHLLADRANVAVRSTKLARV